MSRTARKSFKTKSLFYSFSIKRYIAKYSNRFSLFESYSWEKVGNEEQNSNTLAVYEVEIIRQNYLMEGVY